MYCPDPNVCRSSDQDLRETEDGKDPSRCWETNVETFRVLYGTWSSDLRTPGPDTPSPRSQPSDGKMPEPQEDRPLPNGDSMTEFVVLGPGTPDGPVGCLRQGETDPTLFSPLS